MMDIDFSPPPSPQLFEEEERKKTSIGRKRKNENDLQQQQFKTPKLDLNEPIVYSRATTDRKRKLSDDDDNDYDDYANTGDINIEKKPIVL